MSKPLEEAARQLANALAVAHPCQHLTIIKLLHHKAQERYGQVGADYVCDLALIYQLGAAGNDQLRGASRDLAINESQQALLEAMSTSLRRSADAAIAADRDELRKVNLGQQITSTKVLSELIAVSNLAHSIEPNGEMEQLLHRSVRDLKFLILNPGSDSRGMRPVWLAIKKIAGHLEPVAKLLSSLATIYRLYKGQASGD